MKKSIIFFLSCLSVLTSTAQTIGEAFYIYRNDGQFNAFFRTEIDSIAYSNYDADGNWYEDVVTQRVYTQDSLYQIPLAAIDSVGFVQPMEEYQPGVMRMSEEWLPYVLWITDNAIAFNTNTPQAFLPTTGQTIVAETFEHPFETGFSGRVSEQLTYPDSIVFHVGAVSLNDIYKHLVTVGFSSSEPEGDDVSKPRRVFWNNTAQGWHFPIPNIDLTIGPVTLSCVPDIVLKYVVCVGEHNLKNFVDVKVYQNYQGSVEINCNIDNEYTPEPNWKFTVPITTEVPGLYGEMKFGGFVRASGSVKLSATQPFTVNGVTGFEFSENNGFHGVNDWNASMELPEVSLSIEGSVSAGLAARLQLGVIHERIASVDVTAYLGPKISGHLDLSSNGLVENTLYSAIKDSELTLSLGAEIIPGYRWVVQKWIGEVPQPEEHQELPVSLDLSYPLNHWYAVPEFDNLAWEGNMGTQSGTLNGTISRNLLPKVSLGWGLYDEDDNLYKSYYYSTTYRKLKDWPYNGLELQVEKLPYGVQFKAYPMVKLLGVEMRADKSVDVGLASFPVTLSDFTVTNKQHDEDAFYHDGQYYDYRFDVTVTATLDEEAEGITEWGYAYQDPNGQVALIPLTQFGQTYTDSRYAYFRNGTPPFTCTLYGYVKYEGSNEIVYGEPHDYTLDFSFTSCPNNNHPHMIDLGLPSGTKWACCNVGASTPEGYGNYYAWGETQPKDVYTDVTYSYYSGQDIDGDGHIDQNFSVVNIGSDIGGTNYDAATVNWGAPWRMPSRTQIQELLDNCSSSWTFQNGRSGRQFTGPNGGFIFLPAAGIFYDYYFNGENNLYNGWYISSTLMDERYVFSLVFESFSFESTLYEDIVCSWGMANRESGHSVRPVR